MADKERSKEVDEERQAAPPKAKAALISPMGLVIVVIILVIEGVLVFVVANYFNQTPMEIETPDIAPANMLSLGDPIKLVFYDKKAIVEESMTFDVTLVLSDTVTQQLKSNLETRKPQFRDAITELAYNYGYEAFKRPKPMDALKSSIKERLNNILGRAIITDVYIPNYTPLGPH